MPIHATPTFAPSPHSFHDLRASAALLLTLVSLSGCGGNGDSPDGSSGAVPPPIALTASLSTVKHLTLNWSSPGLALAERALVLEDPDGDGPLPAEQLADVPAAHGAATVDIFLPIALQASYQVALCRAGQCAHSVPLRLQGTLEQAMGRFKAAAPQQGAEFGVAVALSQDGLVLAVGAKSGSVHVFERTGAGQWTSRGEVLGAPASQVQDRAMALSVHGDVLTVGVEDAVHVHRRQGNQWVFDVALQGSEAVAGDGFGRSLALSGDGRTLVVGAPGDAGPGDIRPDDGAVYVFADTSGTWTQTHLLREGNSADSDNFGQSVAISADATVLAIGSPYNDASGFGVHLLPIDNAAATDSGAVYVYRRSSNAWDLEAFAKPPMNLGVGNFGAAVALDGLGNTLAVSAPDADINSQGVFDHANHANSGSVHVLVRTGGQWASLGSPLRSAVPREDELFGQALALSADGQTLVAGAWENNYGGVGVASTESATFVSTAGSGYVFRRLASGWGTPTVLEPSDHSSGLPPSIRMGSAVATSGDGRTVAVGARSHGGPGSGVSSDPAIVYGDDPALRQSGTVFLY